VPVWHSSLSTWAIVTFRPCWADLLLGSKQACPWNQQHRRIVSQEASSLDEPELALLLAEGELWLVAFPRNIWYTCACQVGALPLGLFREELD